MKSNRKTDMKGKNNPNYNNKWTEEQKFNASKRRKNKGIGKDNPNYGNHKLKGHFVTFYVV